ncbi:hypothetical protein UlMin_030147 [Ulmus minor]
MIKMGSDILQESTEHHDMSAPLSHYFVYTGHNSYLIGNQLSSDSCDIPIIKALLKGVRVIELDLWPSTKDDIHVVHEFRLVDEKVRLLSLNEQALEKATTSYGSDLVRFTQRNLLRVYPKGMRATSSNYKPILEWMHGAQMVAFYMHLPICFPSFETALSLLGLGLQLSANTLSLLLNRVIHGMFRANGGCGYLYMGDGWRKNYSQTHSHHRISTPSTRLALLRIEVREYDRSKKDDFGWQTCLPVSELKYGFKAVPLYDKKEDKFKCVKFFMRFQFL